MIGPRDFDRRIPPNVELKGCGGVWAKPGKKGVLRDGLLACILCTG